MALRITTAIAALAALAHAQSDPMPDMGGGGGYDCDQHKSSSTQCNAAKDKAGALVCKFETLMKECQSFNPCAEEMDKTKCNNIKGCSFSGTCMRESEGGGGGGEGGTIEEGECTEYDAAVVKCAKITSKGECTKECEWSAFSGKCEKNSQFDADGCGETKDKTTCTKKASCEWMFDRCDKKMSTDMGGGAGGNEGGSGVFSETTCKDVPNKVFCLNETTTDGDRKCMWAIPDDSSGTDGGGGEGGEGSDCYNLGDKTKCNAAKDSDGKRACAWAVSDSGGVKDEGCGKYDACAQLGDKSSCVKNDKCDWSDDTKCYSKDGGGGGTIGGGGLESCDSQSTKQKCTAFGTLEGGGDDTSATGNIEGGGNDPQCTWAEFTQAACENKDACWLAAKNDESKCKAQGDKCEWADMGQAGACQLKEASFDMECQELKDKGKCGADSKCMWKVEDMKECKQYQKCPYFSKSSCEGATEKCYWDEYGSCYEGDKPTTVITTSTTTTTVTTITTTTTTVFECSWDQWMCADKKQCIQFKYKCDKGTPDCKDGSDEKNCGAVVTQAPPPPATQPVMEAGPTKKPQTVAEKCVEDEYLCRTFKEADDAAKSKPKTSTHLECRECITGRTAKELCARQITNGCEEDATKRPTLSTKAPRTDAAAVGTAPEETAAPPHKCVVSKDCSDNAEASDAKADEPWEASLLCRVCVTGKESDALCATAKSKGCPGMEVNVARKSDAVRESARAFKGFRAKPPTGTAADDKKLHTALYRAVENLPGVRKLQLVDVDMVKVVGSEYYTVVVWYKRFSGMDKDLNQVHGFEVEFGFTPAAVYNTEYWDVDAEDVDGFPVKVGDVPVAAPDAGKVEKELKEKDAAATKALALVKTACETDAASAACANAKTAARIAHDATLAVVKTNSEQAVDSVEAELSKARGDATGDVEALEAKIAALQETLKVLEDQGTAATARKADADVALTKCQAGGSGAGACAAEALEVELAAQMSTAIREKTTAVVGAEAEASKFVESKLPTGSPPLTTGAPVDAASSDDTDDTLVVIVVVVLLILVLVALLVAYMMYKNRAPSYKTQGQRPDYSDGDVGMETLHESMLEAPVLTGVGRVPRSAVAWADPDVPFLSRSEAEAELGNMGMNNGSYVVRQSENLCRGYVVTCVNQGVISNIQLKRQTDSSTLVYGSSVVGSDLPEALRALQMTVPVAPKGQAQYFLTRAADSFFVRRGSAC